MSDILLVFFKYKLEQNIFYLFIHIVIYKVERSRPRSYGIRIYIYTGIQFLSLLKMIFRFAPFAKGWGACGV